MRRFWRGFHMGSLPAGCLGLRGGLPRLCRALLITRVCILILNTLFFGRGIADVGLIQCLRVRDYLLRIWGTYVSIQMCVHMHITSPVPAACRKSTFHRSAHAYSVYTTSSTQAPAVIKLENRHSLLRLKSPDQTGVSWNMQVALKAAAWRRLIGSN